MEKFINEETIIKNDFYESLKDSLICPICSKLLIESIICSSCQKNFCKNCIEECIKKGINCPNRCNNSIFKENSEENLLIKKCKFKCIRGCGEEILFTDIKRHYSSNCLLKINKSKVSLNKNNNKETNYYKSKKI